MGSETAKKIIRYTLTPQIFPRLQGLFSGFSYIAFFMAQIYHAIRLLPGGHPYLNPANMGRYGVRHVVVAASANLVWKREHFDQIVVFGMIMIGLLLLLMQFAMLGVAIFVHAAHAAGPVPNTFAAYFLLQNAEHDLAFVLLDRVFGIPNMFVDAGGGQTCVVTGSTCFDLGQSTYTTELTADGTFYQSVTYTPGVVPGSATGIGWPWPFHIALQKMLEAYSIGILLIAVFIFIYFVAAVVAETAQSGTPFGRRFNHVWAPLRIVAAMGMLVPLTHGLNSGQYILLYAAKFGSGFASNGWSLFTQTAISGNNTLLGNPETLVAQANAPPVNTLVEFVSILAVCKIAYERMYHQRSDRVPVRIDAYLINPSGSAGVIATERFLTTDFAAAVDFFNGGDFIIRFGELRGDEYQTRDSLVSPLCGEVTLQMPHYPEVTNAYPGGDIVLYAYYLMLQAMWQNISNQNALVAANCQYPANSQIQGMIGNAQGARLGDPALTTLVHGVLASGAGCMGQNLANRYLPYLNDPNAPLPTSQFLEFQRVAYQAVINAVAIEARLLQAASSEWAEQLTPLGWGGAAIWYNKVAQLNGNLISALYSMPAVKKYPAAMEAIRARKAAADTDTPGASRHMVHQGPDKPLTLADEEEAVIGKALALTQNLWEDFYSAQKPAGNIYIDVINALFGTSGLFDLQENATLQVHPLAQLAAVGRGILETAIRNLGYSAAAGLGGGIANLFGVHIVGRVGMAASNFLVQIAMVGLSIGFVLFYIVPLFPFIYFFFAVGGWVKGIFEAMVGVPLWALAHIRIDGNGLPGDAALGGYYLILEVFLRPILILFGLLASITIFAAQVQVLHEIWPIVTSNVTGFDVHAAQTIHTNTNQTGGMRYLRGAIDKLFFTVIYAIVIYMMGMSAFKMIDLVPNHILRWMGASVSTFGDQSGDPAQNLMRNAYMGSSMVSSQIGGALSSAGQAASHGTKAVKELAARST